ncbi:hypothetical protein EWM64_g429 [Hericium alpestre]|uniref:Uncharacterized protein n=1 Tax=Hericium alpestre TaxID=135208 RepID=A0A4Z0AB78_9AGAM|nr:hypothetical protein EWM64_g429 [Hericium alpestre]
MPSSTHPLLFTVLSPPSFTTLALSPFAMHSFSTAFPLDAYSQQFCSQYSSASSQSDSSPPSSQFSSDADDFPPPSYPPPQYCAAAASSFDLRDSRPEPVSMGYPLPQTFWNPEFLYPPEEYAEPLALLAPACDVPLHSPIPVQGNWSGVLATSSSYNPDPVRKAPEPEAKVEVPVPEVPKQNLLDAYAQAPRDTFPTPSELLTELTTRQGSGHLVGQKSDRKIETQRRARRRAVTESVGFAPTDPDTISSHDKKRHYLECLEEYVCYLHDQLQLVGHVPVPLARVSAYKGLNSRSIRTMLVHMEDTVRKMHVQNIDDERQFLKLRDEVVASENTTLQEYRRHSTATCAYPAAEKPLLQQS